MSFLACGLRHGLRTAEVKRPVTLTFDVVLLITYFWILFFSRKKGASLHEVFKLDFVSA